jgi:HlyD family secretion protein
MNKFLKYGLIGALCLGALWAAAFFVKSNSKSSITYDTTTAFIASIEKKTVATGKVVPEDEVAIKPQISGIIDVIYLEEGAKVKAGDLIAKVKVVPNEQSLNSAQGRVKNSKISLDNVTIEYNRNKELFEKGVISSQDFNTQKLRMDQATLELENAKADFEIIKLGSAGGSATANTNVRATVSGTILEIPVKEGGMPLEISLGAIEDKTFEARLKFIAPKGVEEAGTVQFKIEGDVKVEEDFLIRAGYSANASLILERKENILVISEALLQFDRDTDKPFVEVSVGEQEFERRDVEIGISDGINVEVLSGVTEEDNIKIWNKTEPIKKGNDEEEEA